MDLNKNRLTNYLNKLVLFPRNDKAPVTKAKSGILNDTPKVPNCLIFSKTKRSPTAPPSTPFPHSSRESDQSQN